MGSVKIQFALLDDANKSLIEGNKGLDTCYKEVRDVNVLASNVISKYEESIKACDTILNQAKTLGIVSKETENIKAIAVKNLKEIQFIKSKIAGI